MTDLPNLNAARWPIQDAPSLRASRCRCVVCRVTRTGRSGRITACEPDGDALLTAWMHRTLTLTVGPVPVELPLSQLESVETAVFRT
jgi:hypothetical protein